MKKLFAMATLLVAAFTSVMAQDISLPTPENTGGMPINQALSECRSSREFDSEKALSLQTVSNLLWATCGINRTDSGMRTNPTARNFQEIDVYWFDQNGVYKYSPYDNILVEVAKGDHRVLVAGPEAFKQDFTLDAPGSVVIVADTTKPGLTAALIDAGIASENLNLFCAGNGLSTVPRMTMDVNGIQQLLS